MTTYYEQDLKDDPLSIVPPDVAAAITLLAAWQQSTGVAVRFDFSTPFYYNRKTDPDQPPIPYITLSNIPRRWIRKHIKPDASKSVRSDSLPYPRIYGDFVLAGTNVKLSFDGDAEHNIRLHVEYEARHNVEERAKWMADQLLKHKHPLDDLEIVGGGQ